MSIKEWLDTNLYKEERREIDDNLDYLITSKEELRLAHERIDRIRAKADIKRNRIRRSVR